MFDGGSNQVEMGYSWLQTSDSKFLGARRFRKTHRVIESLIFLEQLDTLGDLNVDSTSLVGLSGTSMTNNNHFQHIFDFPDSLLNTQAGYDEDMFPDDGERNQPM